ncbi:MAG: DUF6946 family protein [Terriglobales bacterium]
MRSTVPLLQFWHWPEKRIIALMHAIGAPEASAVELAFEYPTAVREGRGKHSFTDLMGITDAAAVAIEAKYTEPQYESVASWLGPQPSENRRNVLRGWLEMVDKIVGRWVSPETVSGIPYQVIHRTASVCCVDRPIRSVVYQVFASNIPPY